MAGLNTRSIGRIEERMSGLEENSIRRRLLECAKNFKMSWVELAQALYAVWKDKLYRQWGYLTFDAYTSKEIGIRKQTALKLLKSYHFLESEEASYLKDYPQSPDVSRLPNYEAVNVLRLAKNNSRLDKVDYLKMRRDVLETGKDAGAVKKDLTALMKQAEELEPEEARNNRRVEAIKRLLRVLRNLKSDLEISKLLPQGTIKEISSLINRIEAEISR